MACAAPCLSQVCLFAVASLRCVWRAQQPAPARACRFYAGEMVMSMLALTAALYGVAAAHKWSFSVFLGLQGDLPWWRLTQDTPQYELPCGIITMFPD